MHCVVIKNSLWQRVFKNIILLFIVFALFINTLSAQFSGSDVFYRVSRLSSFEFGIASAGGLYADGYVYTKYFSHLPIGYWPRGSFHLIPQTGNKGFIFLAKKSGVASVSGANFQDVVKADIQGPFAQTVPGRIGDPYAGYDSLAALPGSRYILNNDYIVYSSLDYDSTGNDISGANYNDYPIREVNGKRKYIADPLERRFYPPVYTSEEDLFTIFKDTDSRAGRKNLPIGDVRHPLGIEVRLYVSTWGSKPLDRVVVFEYEILNKSGVKLDSCYIGFGTGIPIGRSESSTAYLVPTDYRFIQNKIGDRIGIQLPQYDPNLSRSWRATPTPPTIGVSYLATPRSYSGQSSTMIRAINSNQLEYIKIDSINSLYTFTAPDSIKYRQYSVPPKEWFYDKNQGASNNAGLYTVCSTFPMKAGDTTTFSVALMFADSLPHLFTLDDLIRKMYAHGLKKASPTDPSQLTAKGLDRAILLKWTDAAEHSTDIIIPDSLGRAFYGYQLWRGTRSEGPYKLLGRWTVDSGLVHEYVDHGADIGGLKNNVRYYYRIESFDEGVLAWNMDPMSSPFVDGLNQTSTVPSTEAENTTVSPAGGLLLSGDAGSVSSLKIVPTSTTNYANRICDHTLSVSLEASTNGIYYTIPLTIQDTLAGLTMNAVVDPIVQVHGSTLSAGIKEGTARVADIFGIGAADLEVTYRYEQLADSFKVSAQMHGQADVPIILYDDAAYTGVVTITPYTTQERHLCLVFLSGGVDTLSALLRRYVSYLSVTLIDLTTGTALPDSEYIFVTKGIKTSGLATTLNGKPRRYYFSGTLSNNETWDFGALLEVYNSRVAFDFPNRGIGSGKAGPSFSWSSPGRGGTKEFQAGDSVMLTWKGGMKGTFPKNARFTLAPPTAGRSEVTTQMLEKIRIVPNPYIVHHEGQRGRSVLYFNYLPEECTIRIYTVALGLVKTIRHSGGSREEWNLLTEGGQTVASQLLLAHIEAHNGISVTKKFAVVLGK